MSTTTFLSVLSALILISVASLASPILTSSTVASSRARLVSREDQAFLNLGDSYNWTSPTHRSKGTDRVWLFQGPKISIPENANGCVNFQWGVNNGGPLCVSKMEVSIDGERYGDYIVKRSWKVEASSPVFVPHWSVAEMKCPDAYDDWSIHYDVDFSSQCKNKIIEPKAPISDRD